MPVVSTIQQRCKACYACIRYCPVKAIKVEEKQAKIYAELCISCGSCVRVCAQGAKQIESDLELVREKLKCKTKVVALLAPSFPVSFSEIEPGQLLQALKANGFFDVRPVTEGVEATLPLYKKHLKDFKGTLISSYCPSIVALIEKKFPNLIPSLAPFDSAVLATAKLAKKDDPEVFTVFIGPCIAKKEEARSPAGQGILDAVLTFRELKELIPDPARYQGLLTDKWEERLAQLFPISGGLLRNLEAEGIILPYELAMIEGKDQSLETLQCLSEGQKGPKFLDILFCRGCIDGPEIDSSLEFFTRKARMFDVVQNKEIKQRLKPPKNLSLNRSFESKFKELPEPNSFQIQEILKFTYKTNREDELNCGACGYNTCREKAIAVYRGLAEIDMCFPYLLHNSRGELEYYRDQLKTYDQGSNPNVLNSIVGRSEAIKDIKFLIERAAKSDSTILIQGESGVGKEVISQAVHQLSQRSQGPFLGINCAALPELLLESELFGYEEGAFTGARKGGKPGKFELARGGTILLDEIGDMPLNMQSKMLRVLQEREFERVGGTKTIKMDVRLIAATNKDLKKLVNEGKFRQDLYYRINVIGLYIPPLRERKDDIEPLVEVLTAKLTRDKKISPKMVGGDTLEYLKAHNWPGNTRELENVLERALYMAEGNIIRPEHLPANLLTNQLANPSQTVRPLKEAVRELERELIVKALKACDNNRQSAAQLLGIPRATLYLRLKEFDLIE